LQLAFGREGPMGGLIEPKRSRHFRFREAGDAENAAIKPYIGPTPANIPTFARM
jgi:hypothetical protein